MTSETIARFQNCYAIFPKRRMIMKDYLNRLKTSCAWFVVVVTCLSVSPQTQGKGLIQAQAGQAALALDGVDPVLLVQGKEVLGNTKISVIRKGFEYLFSTEENKALFEKSPEKYEIQLEGSCARMGPQVGGNPETYSVYQGHIYIFGSEPCKKLFDATPEKYLDSATAKEVRGTAEAMKKGLALIEKAIAAMGGAAKVDGVTTYQQTGLAVARQQQQETPYKAVVTRLFPDRVRLEQTRSFGTVINIISGGESFTVFKNGESANVNLLSLLARDDIRRQSELTVLEIVRARHRPDFKASYIGAEKRENGTTEQVEASFDGLYLKLGIDAASGQIVSLAYRGRNRSNGELGDVVKTFADYRNIEGLTLPFKTTGTFNGQSEPEQTYTLESIAFNIKPDPAAFEKPKPTGAQ
jgi:YHS domain-containing protein